MFLSLIVSFLPLFAHGDGSHEHTEVNDVEQQLLYEAYVDSLVQTFDYQRGTVTLGRGIASIQVPSGLKFLNASDSKTVLVNLWGNPPNETEGLLGMLFRESDSPMTDSSYAVSISYVEDGYIDDSEAGNIIYDDLLRSMQADTRAGNAYRVQMGYEPIWLLGWAQQPFYDAANKKLHWAKKLRFGDYPENTLNYSIRVLGRKGFLELNIISEMFMLADVQSNVGPIVNAVNFNEGYTYTDFDPNIDKVAAYGIGALITGKILAKTGILTKIGVLLAKIWKILAFGAIALLAVFRQLMVNKGKKLSPQA